MSCRVMHLAAAMVILLAGCSSKRPEGTVCQGLCARPEGPISLVPSAAAEVGTAAEAEPSAVGAMASESFGEQLRSLMLRKAESIPRGAPERALTDLPGEDDGRLNLLALSAGGPFGAFGAGFLNGWSEQTAGDLARPEAFDVVTGVSAGALLATHAFLGRAGDPVLARQYTTISTEDVLKERSLFAALFSNALFDTSPLRRTLEGLVTPALLNEVADATDLDETSGQPARFLLVLAVDLDSGQPRILDLGAIARDRNAPDRINSYIDALMASAAIPIAFPPVFIDGAMHADGGTRLALFFNRYMEEQRAGIKDLNVPPPRLDIIVNSDITLRPSCTPNTLVGIGKRTFSVVLDQLSLDSLYRTVSEAERDGIDVRYVTAEGSGCTPPENPADMFQRKFLQCLFAHGEKVGASQTPWQTGLDGFPGLEVGKGGLDPAGCPTS